MRLVVRVQLKIHIQTIILEGLTGDVLVTSSVMKISNRKPAGIKKLVWNMKKMANYSLSLISTMITVTKSFQMVNS